MNWKLLVRMTILCQIKAHLIKKLHLSFQEAYWTKHLVVVEWF